MFENNTEKSIRKRRKIRTTIIASMMIISFLLGNFIVRFGVVFGPNSDSYSYAIKMAEKYPEFKTLLEVRTYIQELYDGKISKDVLAEDATKAMTNALGDQYTVYMTEKEFNKYMESNSGSYMGIGVYVTVTNNQVVVSGLVPGGNAEKVGIKAGDIIQNVDGVAVGSDIDKTVSLITGSEEKTLTIGILRGNQEAINIQVKRGKIETSAVDGKMINQSVGYIHLKAFDRNASSQFTAKLDELTKSGMKGLILDLRDNGGGYLDEAVNIASDFIPNGKTVTYTIDKYNKKVVNKASGNDVKNIPVVLLINQNTASASEVLTGALRDYKIAKTVGVTSFGKGIVQEIFHLDKGEGGLKVTVSKYYTPNGENIHKKGIKPDYDVPLPEGTTSIDATADSDNQFQKALQVIQGEIK